jgi:hypothetical protein
MPQQSTVHPLKGSQTLPIDWRAGLSWRGLGGAWAGYRRYTLVAHAVGRCRPRTAAAGGRPQGRP